MAKAKPQVTYGEIYRIASTGSLTYTQKNARLQGCILRLVTETITNVNGARRHRQGLDHRIIEVYRYAQKIARKYERASIVKQLR